LHLSDDEELARYLNINLLALMRVSRGFLKTVEGPASIVNIASIYGLVGFTNSAPYSASKAGVIGLTRQMAADYGPRQIRVNAVAPGLIVTPLTEKRLAANSAWQEAMTGSTPLGRLGRHEDIAYAVAFLAASDAAFITGQVLTVDGGWSATRFLSEGVF
jgi:3-oxoacyl-[acyl-carrier protein] reductase